MRSLLSRVWNALTTHLGNWNEVYFFLPVAMIGAIYLNFFIKNLDPTVGVENLGSLSAYSILFVRLVLTMFGAWLIKRFYFGWLPLRIIRDLKEQTSQNNRGARDALIVDRLEWVPCLAVAYFVFSQ